MEKMLAYQKVDGELFRLEKQLIDSEHRKKIVVSKDIANQTKEKMFLMEEEAKKLYESYVDLQKIIDSNLKNVEILNNHDIDKLDLEKIKVFQQKAELVLKNLQLLQKKLSNLQSMIQNELTMFNKSTKTLQQAKKEFNSSKEIYDKQSAQVLPKIDALKNELNILAKDIDKALFEKYQKCRKDKIYPVFVPLAEKRCGACRVELPSAILDSIKGGKMLECEQCRRIIYYNKFDN